MERTIKKLTHVDPTGRANMVDISPKPIQLRTAKACGHISLNREALALVRENRVKKGDVMTTAEIAGIQGGKRTADLIPLCHPLQITNLEVRARTVRNGIRVESIARCLGPTGVEMEALTAVSVALLTIYDMCKAVDRNMVLGEIRLLEKTKEDAIRDRRNK